MSNEKIRQEVLDKIIDIFVDTIGFIPRDQVHSNTNVVKDFKIYTDDLSLFLKNVDQYFCLNSVPEEWGDIATIEQITNFVVSQAMLRSFKN